MRQDARDEHRGRDVEGHAEACAPTPHTGVAHERVVEDVYHAMRHERDYHQPRAALEAGHGKSNENRGDGHLGPQDFAAAIDDGEQHVVRGGGHEHGGMEHALTIHAQPSGRAAPQINGARVMPTMNFMSQSPI